MNIERRDSPRIPFEQDVVVYARGRALSCRAADLSAGGIGLWASERVQPGEHVIVDMGLGGGKPLAVEGYIVREARDARAAERYNWGVRFHGLAPRVQRLLADHVAEHPLPAPRHRAVASLREREPHRRPPPVSPLPVSPGCGVSPRQSRLLARRALETQNTPTPAPAPAFEQPLETPAQGELATRAEPSPRFTTTPEPMPALPPNPRPRAPWMGPRPSSPIDPAVAERDRRRAELYRLAREAAEDRQDDD